MARGGPKLSLIETALLLSLLGVVLAVFVPTFVRRIRTNKISEAATLLEEMSRGANAYYDTSWSSGEQHCLPPAAGPTPEAPSVDSRTVDFLASETPGHETWKALGFQPNRPIRYSYEYAPTRAGCGLGDAGAEVVFRARGDLDGDGVRSTFERHATAAPDGLAPDEILRVHQRTE